MSVLLQMGCPSFRKGKRKKKGLHSRLSSIFLSVKLLPQRNPSVLPAGHCCRSEFSFSELRRSWKGNKSTVGFLGRTSWANNASEEGEMTHDAVRKLWLARGQEKHSRYSGTYWLWIRTRARSIYWSGVGLWKINQHQFIVMFMLSHMIFVCFYIHTCIFVTSSWWPHLKDHRKKCVLMVKIQYVYSHSEYKSNESEQ